MQCMPGDEVWLVGERRSTGEQKYYVSNLPGDTTLKRLAATIKARWVCEQAHQQLKEELGLDHFEGRSWTGLHRHALMTLIAYAFLQTRRLKATGRKKRIGGPPPQPSMPVIRQAILDLFARPPPYDAHIVRGSSPMSSRRKCQSSASSSYPWGDCRDEAQAASSRRLLLRDDPHHLPGCWLDNDDLLSGERK